MFTFSPRIRLAIVQWCWRRHPDKTGSATNEPPDSVQQGGTFVQLQRRTTRMKLITILLAALLMSAACVTNTPPSQGVIRGHVQRFVCPGLATSQPCPPKPVSGLTLSFSRVDGGKVFSATTGASGDYSAVLAPGIYRIELSISAVDYGGPRTIALRSGTTVIANFEYRISTG
jgi:hypothetical protein